MCQKALNRVLTLPKYGRGAALLESSGLLEKGQVFDGQTLEILQKDHFCPNVIYIVVHDYNDYKNCAYVWGGRNQT